ncbi:MAG: chemotaxis protein CheR [Bacteroidetes bacterium HGW-Bacteroidetes-17]|jgi:chemotaxis protein methyltransferase CheR|nr:MAG: chemotaxis protein CheR [Bacteroidetes bacterium HGW-Bacteroidetes-17]
MENKTDLTQDNINIEIDLFLEAIFQKYGYDFRNYGKAHIKRRLLHRMQLSKAQSISEMQYKVLYEEAFFNLILKDFSINVTEMFRDPSFYKNVREEIIPILKTYPFIKIWHAGCSSGEEVYSMAILLMEEGLYDRTQIYATDFNHQILRKAKEGIYPISKIKEFTANYQKSGGTKSFSDYYMAKYESVIFNNELKKNIIFADHNLVTDKAFAEVHMIVCRNVLIYFNKDLQNQVLKLFTASLLPGGYLCLGTKETIRFSEANIYYHTIIDNEKIFKKKLQLESTGS